MVKSSSRGKYNRGKARARARRSPRRTGTTGWTAGIAAIVILGIVGIVLAKSANNQAGGLKIGDHWHAAFGVNVCGTWLPNPPETARDSTNLIVRHGTDVYAGIHTHADGLIHFEPETTDDTGTHATVGYSLLDQVARARAYLRGAGLRAGDRCALLGPNSIRWAAIDLALMADRVDDPPRRKSANKPANADLPEIRINLHFRKYGAVRVRCIVALRERIWRSVALALDGCAPGTR